MKLVWMVGWSFLSVLVAVVGPAAAADPNWSGFYVGASAGYLASNASVDAQSASSDGASLNLDSSRSRSFFSSDPQLGMFGGYNRQLQNIVVGLEADLSWRHTNSTKQMLPGRVDCPIGFFCGDVSSSGDKTSVQLGWNGSIRPRAGYLLTPDTLIYGTGGLAIGSAKIAQTCQFSLSDPLCSTLAGNPSATSTTTRTLVGFTVGTGLEKMFEHWAIRAEYQYTQYANITAHSVLTASSGGVSSTQTLNSSVGISSHLFNLGVAYKF